MIVCLVMVLMGHSLQCYLSSSFAGKFRKKLPIVYKLMRSLLSKTTVNSQKILDIICLGRIVRVAKTCKKSKHKKNSTVGI